MSDEEGRLEVRRRSVAGDPPFLAGDRVLVHFWHSICWDPYIGTVVDIRNVKGGKVMNGGGPLGVRIVETPWKKKCADRGIVIMNEFCTHSEHWTLLRFNS